MRYHRFLPAAAAATLALAGVAACKGKKEQAISIQTAPVERQDIVIDAEATGVVEPINVVEVKSKASGQIEQMPVETGTQVKPGDLLVRVDTRDVQSSFNQAQAQVSAARANLEVTGAQKRRTEQLLKDRIITQQEMEAASLAYAQAEASLVRARADLDLAQQRLDDAVIRAPVAGTVIEKTVSLGQVITSATGAFGGGTTLLKMADLSQVRVRALVNETDIGQVQPGQSTRVTVDAYPDRPFQGTVEKIEPQATVQQNVTMFPVLVSINNREGLLKPGMNGEVSILIDERRGVLAVPNDAVRNPREAQQVAQMLGLDPDTVRAQLAAQFGGAMGGPGGGPGAAAADTPAGARVNVSRGEVALSPAAQQQSPGQGGGQMQLPEVTDKQCADVRAAFAKDTGAQGKLQALMQRVRAGEIDRDQMRAESQKIYAGLGLDGRVAMACRFRERGGAPGTQGGTQGGTRGGATGASSGGAGGGGGGMGGGRTRSGLVMVAQGGTYVPRIVRLGVSNYDYTEVMSGVKEGEQVALLAAASLQLQRQQQQERMRGMMGSGMQKNAAGQTPIPGGGGPPGGGRRGGNP